MTYNDLFFLKPYFKEAVWGELNSSLLKNYFPTIESLNKKIGEVWILSTISNHETKIQNSEYKDLLLKDLLIEKNFPLIKIIYPKDALSVQIHPNNYQAKKYSSSSLGKSEAWYILDCLPNAKIVYGLKTYSLEKIKMYTFQNKLYELLNYRKIKKENFINIPANLVHSLTSKILVYEIQQASDITWRIYDYDRQDKNRKLNISEFFSTWNKKINKNKDSKFPSFSHIKQNKILVLKTFFCSLWRITNNSDITSKYSFKNKWVHCFVVEAKNAFVENIKIECGQSFIAILKKKFLSVKGKVKMLIAHN